MANPLDLGLRLMQLLDSIGIKPNTFLGKGSNVKKAFSGGKPTFFKPDVLETLRSQNGTFTDALKLAEEESQFIVNATDAEKMAFINNLTEYKSLGGPQKTKGGITALDQAKNLTEEAKNLQTSTEDLMSLAKSMKDDAEKNLAKSKKDLDDFFTTGGQPLKAKDNKFLGGSMYEEGQLRTGIRQFLQTEYKQGRLKLNDLDRDRIMEYSPMIEHDPILVFKKIYGDDAYTKAGSFPGAFEKGENFKQYENIFRENMGEDLLKVTNKEYQGDGRLMLTEMEEIKPPTPDDPDPDIPFAEGGLAALLGEPQGYYTGGMVDVEPNLSDIGHGSDSLMARTRLISPNNQATTSTGLNYLLAEDNDNLRVPFSNGKIVEDMDEVVEDQKEVMGPLFETNDPKKAIKEIIKRRINVDPAKIPLSKDLMLMFDLDKAKIGGEKELFGGEVQFGINKGFGRDDLGYGFNFRKEFAGGGIAGIRQGFFKGGAPKGVDLARRGFLKVLAGTAGTIAALKSGVFKMLGKSSTKAIPKIVEVGSGSGVPQWFEPMVNKVLADGLDVTKTNAVIDGQTVKRLKTDKGEIDVYHNERSGEIDVEYTSETHAALGEPVHLNYKPGSSMADEGNPSPPDEFMASESIPEGRQTGPDDYTIETGENTIDEVGGLFSDTSELEKIGGGDINMRQILKNIEKRKKLKQMQDRPVDFVTDVQGDYDPT
jgi:hypothetical protein